jgi:uncharacterized protein YqgC (DUF456 family)
MVTICLLVLGFVGTLIPFLPGHLILFFAALGHWLMLRGDSGVEWWTFVVLGVLLILSQVFEFLSGAAGTRWFGGTRWGAFGALIGGIGGIFFIPFGLILGCFCQERSPAGYGFRGRLGFRHGGWYGDQDHRWGADDCLVSCGCHLDSVGW